MKLHIMKESINSTVRTLKRFYIYPEKNEIHINNMFDYHEDVYKAQETWLLGNGAIMLTRNPNVWGTKWSVTADIITLFTLRWM